VQVKTKNLLMGTLVVLLVGALWYKVVYSPMESKASKAKSAAHDANETASNLQARINAINTAKAKAKTHAVANQLLLQAVPADAAESSFLRSVDALRISSGADWQSITPGVPVLSGALSTINVSIAVQGTEAQLQSYENGLYDLKRVFLVDSINFSSNGSSAAPGAPAPHAAPGQVFSGGLLQMQITGRVFSQPAVSVAPGATGKSGATGASGTSAGATTPATGAPAPTGVQNN
jgi:Tfp pilus assembly protein PilO